MRKTLVLVGRPGAEHIGAHLNRAAEGLGFQPLFLDSGEAFDGPVWVRRFNWRLRGHLPTHLNAFSERILKVCQQHQPAWLLSLGIAPVHQQALEVIGKLKIRRLNYLTDDPWSPAHRSPWFFKALPFYDEVFTTRRANRDDLQDCGVPKVSYLPFGYEPTLHFPESPGTEEEKKKFDSEVMFYGGADPDRVPYIAAFVQAGFRVALYGGYWDRFGRLGEIAKGSADARTLRLAVGGAKVVLCLVRRANRDDNSMRTFEVPAMGGCLLAEDTPEHQNLFGQEGAVYFKSPREAVEKLRWLLSHPQERKQLTTTAHRLILEGEHTYEDRLKELLSDA